MAAVPVRTTRPQRLTARTLTSGQVRVRHRPRHQPLTALLERAPIQTSITSRHRDPSRSRGTARTRTWDLRVMNPTSSPLLHGAPGDSETSPLARSYSEAARSLRGGRAPPTRSGGCCLLVEPTTRECAQPPYPFGWFGRTRHDLPDTIPDLCDNVKDLCDIAIGQAADPGRSRGSASSSGRPSRPRGGIPFATRQRYSRCAHASHSGPRDRTLSHAGSPHSR